MDVEAELMLAMRLDELQYRALKLFPCHSLYLNSCPLQNVGLICRYLDIHSLNCHFAGTLPHNHLSHLLVAVEAELMLTMRLDELQ